MLFILHEYVSVTNIIQRKRGVDRSSWADAFEVKHCHEMIDKEHDENEIYIHWSCSMILDISVKRIIFEFKSVNLYIDPNSVLVEVESVNPHWLYRMYRGCRGCQ